MHATRTITMLLTAVLLTGCGMQQNLSAKSAARHAATANQRADAAILDAEAAIRDADRATQLASSVNAVAPGSPQVTPAEQYRRTSLNLRSQAISYADLAAKAKALAANVDDPAEAQHWRDTAADCAARSKKLYELSDEYARLARKAK